MNQLLSFNLRDMSRIFPNIEAIEQTTIERDCEVENRCMVTMGPVTTIPPLDNIPTCRLVEELKTRDGVDYRFIDVEEKDVSICIESGPLIVMTIYD